MGTLDSSCQPTSVPQAKLMPVHGHALVATPGPLPPKLCPAAFPDDLIFVQIHSVSACRPGHILPFPRCLLRWHLLALFASTSFVRAVACSPLWRVRAAQTGTRPVSLTAVPSIWLAWRVRRFWLDKIPSHCNLAPLY